MPGSYPNQIDRYQDGGWKRTESEVIVEAAVSLTVNGEPWLTFRCTPINLEALAVGFLFDEGLIKARDEIASVYVCERQDNIDVWINHPVQKPALWQRTSGCTGGMTAVESIYNLPPLPVNEPSKDLQDISPEQVNSLVRLLFKAQHLYRSAGGVHTSVLSDGASIIVSSEDIGRHNTLDKIAGLCLLQDLHPPRRILLTTGRISSEMIQKAARIGASVVISYTSPSSVSIQLAQQMGIVLIGYARGSRFNVYSHPEKVKNNGRSKNDSPAAYIPASASRGVL